MKQPLVHYRRNKSKEKLRETEGFIIAAQDQRLYTTNYQARIIKNEDDSKYRMLDQYDENVDHLVFSCSVIRPT